MNLSNKRIVLEKIIFIFSSSNEGDDSSICENVTDNEQYVKISNAILPYLEQLHKLLIDPPYVSINVTFNTCCRFQI